MPGKLAGAVRGPGREQYDLQEASAADMRNLLAKAFAPTPPCTREALGKLVEFLDTLTRVPDNQGQYAAEMKTAKKRLKAREIDATNKALRKARSIQIGQIAEHVSGTLIPALSDLLDLSPVPILERKELENEENLYAAEMLLDQVRGHVGVARKELDKEPGNPSELAKDFMHLGVWLGIALAEPTSAKLRKIIAGQKTADTNRRAKSQLEIHGPRLEQAKELLAKNPNLSRNAIYEKVTAESGVSPEAVRKGIDKDFTSFFKASKKQKT